MKTAGTVNMHLFAEADAEGTERQRIIFAHLIMNFLIIQFTDLRRWPPYLAMQINEAASPCLK